MLSHVYSIISLNSNFLTIVEIIIPKVKWAHDRTRGPIDPTDPGKPAWT
jgi:hypothetical protein